MCKMTVVAFVIAVLLSVTVEVRVQEHPDRPTGYVTIPASSYTPGHEDIRYSVNNGGSRKFIIDTDAGSDDAVAIFAALGSQELNLDVEVIAITVVHGNTNADNVGRNVLKILDTGKRLDIPVHKGLNNSVLFTPETDGFYGNDGFGDFQYPNPPSEDLISKQHAVDALVELVQKYPGQVNIVCLGPLSNIALAIRMYPRFLEKAERVFILGGSTEGTGNTKPGVEFNFNMDPEAVFIVFSEAARVNKPLVLVPWETVALRGLVDMEWRTNVLGAIDSPQVRILNQAENLQLVPGEPWYAADALLAAVALDKSVVTSSDAYHVDVEICGHFSRGSLFVGYESRSENKTKNVEIVKQIDVDQFKGLLLKTLDPWGGATNGALRLT